MCDCLVALPSATRQPLALFAKNSDRPPDEPQVIERVRPRRHIGPMSTTHIAVDPWPSDTIDCVISRPTWCWGAEHGVNAAGVAIGNEAIYTTLDPRRAEPALIGMDLVRLGLERADTASRAVEVITELLERYGQGGTGHDPHGVTGPKPYWSSFLIADPTSAWVVETSGRVWMSEAVETTRAISNRTTITAFDAVHRHPDQPVERLVDPRLLASQAVLQHQPVSVESLAPHLRSHDSGGEAGWSVCMHTATQATTASMIAELRVDGHSRVWMLLGHPCQAEYVEHSLS
jgi:secernin